MACKHCKDEWGVAISRNLVIVRVCLGIASYYKCPKCEEKYCLLNKS